MLILKKIYFNILQLSSHWPYPRGPDRLWHPPLSRTWACCSTQRQRCRAIVGCNMGFLVGYQGVAIEEVEIVACPGCPPCIVGLHLGSSCTRTAKIRNKKLALYTHDKGEKEKTKLINTYSCTYNNYFWKNVNHILELNNM